MIPNARRVLSQRNLWQDGILLGGRKLRLAPHIISEATRALRSKGAITVEHRTPRNLPGRTVELLVPADQRRRKSYIDRAVGRKSLLYGRYLLLSRTAGDAGEEVLRHSLSTAGSHLIEIESGFGEVHNLMNVRLYGSLDSGAWLFHVDPATRRPLIPYALPIEVKNRRQVLYPIHKEVHQLLSKAADVQKANPGQPVVPILICRAGHPWLFWMAKDLGFLVHQTRRQFVSLPAKMTAQLFNEVRTELGLTDLTLVTNASRPRIQEFFKQTIVKQAKKAAPRWAVSAQVIAEYSNELRTEGMGSGDRLLLIRDLRQEMEYQLERAGFTEPLLTWSLPDEEEWQDQTPYMEGWNDNDAHILT